MVATNYPVAYTFINSGTSSLMVSLNNDIQFYLIELWAG